MPVIFAAAVCNGIDKFTQFSCNAIRFLCSSSSLSSCDEIVCLNRQYKWASWPGSTLLSLELQNGMRWNFATWYANDAFSHSDARSVQWTKDWSEWEEAKEWWEKVGVGPTRHLIKYIILNTILESNQMCERDELKKKAHYAHHKHCSTVEMIMMYINVYIWNLTAVCMGCRILLTTRASAESIGHWFIVCLVSRVR